ncbi:hypothetical protein PLICRDRAFT_171186 [Plicaturopsis crispa FD-325 SS-3]|nr:hypothetical protein PLICRDRAFT_171186 [Plicaturopsis crispa FD-325 SS-3]
MHSISKVLITFVPLFLSLCGTAGAKVFALQPSSYPDVADHHCIAFACAGLNPKSKGFHRDTSTVFTRNRRHAIGCDGVTQCGGGNSCDEIPYASSFDGGLGCFASDWTITGHSVNRLYSWGTHRCVKASDNSAHGRALQRFYSTNRIANLETYTVSLLLPPRGCSPAKYCNGVVVQQNTGHPNYVDLCRAANNDGRKFAKIVRSQYSQAPRCPSRNYRREELGTSNSLEPGLGEDDDINPGDASEFDFDALVTAGNATLPDSSSPMSRVARLESGHRVLELFGSLSVGDEVWVHDETLLEGTLSKVANVTTVAEAFADLALEGRQTC